MKRGIIYLAAALLFALVVWLVERPESSRINDVSSDLLYSDYDAKEIDRIEIGKLLEGVQLKKGEDGKWMVAEFVTPIKAELNEKEGRSNEPVKWFRADSSKVKSALGKFGALEKGILVSSAADKRNMFEVGAMGLFIKCYDDRGNEALNLVIGKNGPDFISNYLRKGDSDEVYLVSVPLQGIFSIEPNDWRDAKMLSIPTGEITSVEVDSGGKSMRIERRSDGSWTMTLPEEKDLDKNDVTAYLDKIAVLNADEFGDLFPGGDVMTLKIGLSTGDIKTLEFVRDARSKKGKWMTRFAGDDEIYVVPKWWIEQLWGRFSSTN